MTADTFPPKPGRDHETRDGQRVTELDFSDRSLVFGVVNGTRYTWRTGGRFYGAEFAHPLDTIGLWEEADNRDRGKMVKPKSGAPAGGYGGATDAKAAEVWERIESDIMHSPPTEDPLLEIAPADAALFDGFATEAMKLLVAQPNDIFNSAAPKGYGTGVIARASYEMARAMMDARADALSEWAGSKLGET